MKLFVFTAAMIIAAYLIDFSVANSTTPQVNQIHELYQSYYQ
jgi:hypothetical protein